MDQEQDIVEELLQMAKDPASFTKDDLAEMVLVAATEIIKLRSFPSPWTTRPDEESTASID
ncbi:hypothetical protein [Aquamicrobium sp. LC103]|uniref:hypothetical protein n=1 Tax=Aquamicrobium sp. LC103 TaxID=1120658 RepID=UPI00109C4023|nr:hypothetical protein [Aquamicrobium sp. LC103]TKT69626.1 hypothetical protein XW59_026135 [Aquamicrobium sp. LC103]